MNFKPLLIAAAAYLAVKAIRKVTTVEKFAYSLESLPTFKISGSLILISVNVGITNKQEESFNIRKVYGELLVNGSHVGNVESGAPFTIAAYAKTVVNLSVNLAITNALLSLIQVLTATSGALVVSVVGAVVTDLISVPLTITKKFR